MERPRARTLRPRRHGKPPFRTVVVHGGPGARGSMAPVARGLTSLGGVLEPWQTARSVAGQVEELFHQIAEWAEPPVVLVGHSWGAWLSLLLGSEHPEQVRSIVLVGCAPLTPPQAGEIARRRRQRLTPAQWKEYGECLERVQDESSRTSRSAMRRLGELAQIADSYEVLPHPPERIEPDPEMFRVLWPEAESMRRSGALSRLLRRVRVPILVIHGESDPHPVEGVIAPLRRAGADVRVVLLERCGHEPWHERYARERFFQELRAELVSRLKIPLVNGAR